MQRKLSLEDVAKITKIQARILEKLESGQLDGLPAEVFVKGFVRSFAKCVGLPETEAIERYASAQSGQATAIAKALVETMNPTVRLVEPKALAIEPAVSDDEIAAPSAPVAAAPIAPVAAAPIAPVAAAPIAPVAAAPIVETAPVQVVEVVHVAELAPVTPIAAPSAPVEIVHVAELAPIAPIASTPVVEIAAALTASLVANEPAPKKKRTRKKSPTAAQKAAAESTDAASADAASTVTAASPAPKAPRSRKKKTTVSPVVAIAAVDAAMTTTDSTATATTAIAAATEIATDAPSAAVDAPATLPSSIEDTTTASETTSDTQLDTAAESLPETTRFVRLDATSDGALATVAVEHTDHDLAELHEAASFAMSLTSEYELEVSIDDSTAEDLQLAEGSSVQISSSAIEVEDRTVGTWQPTMPAMASTPNAPWRRPQLPTQNAYVVPSLVIDDADPDSADREREVRASKEHSRLSFLPPILRDREDRSARQGGLTLAVIILLIAATLTLSYLMRRPSPSGDGVTMLDGQTQLYS
jgi:hypothetical protein